MNKKVVFILILSALVLVFGFAASRMNRSKYDSQKEALDAQLADLATKITTLENTKAKQAEEMQTIYMGTSGFNMSKREKDDEAAEVFFSDIFTWDSYKEYMEKRSNLIKKQGLSEKSSFVTVFMPQPKIEKNDSGKIVWNHIDDGNLNMSFEGITTYVAGISEDKATYTYVAKVTFSASDVNGYEAKSHAICVYEADGSSNIKNPEGYIDSESD